MQQFSKTRLLIIPSAIILFAGLSFLSTECQAQRRRFVLGQELGRFLGAGHGAGYHCSNPGQNTGYYNPYSAHNSQLSPPGNYNYGHQAVWGTSGSIPHSSYTNRDPQQHSVFEQLPGQSVRPKFEPAENRTGKDDDEDDFETDSNIDFDTPSELQRTQDSFDPSEFNTERPRDFSDDADDAADELGSAIEEMEDALGDAGDFDSLKDNFEQLKGGSGTRDTPAADSFESLLE